MDAKTLEGETDAVANTVASWISRGYLPGVTPDAPGRAREFDVNLATHIAIMASLTHFGFRPTLASLAAGLSLSSLKKGYRYTLVADPKQEGPADEAGEKLGLTIEPFNSDAREALEKVAPEERPLTYLTIDVAAWMDKMQNVEAKYQSDPEIIKRRRMAELRAEMRSITEGGLSNG